MDLLILALGIFLQLVCLPVGIYNLFIGLFGFIPMKDKPTVSDKIHKFALVVSAHNEDAVIENLINSLKNIDYPKDAYDIFVIADNCSDKTADISAATGVNVLIRNDKNRGKGFALGWGFDKIMFGSDNSFDYVCVFDADNLVHPGFLRAMNHRANQGYEVIQGYCDSKNPFDSWVTSSYSLAFWNIARTFQLARHRLGLCCELMGTGFSIQVPLLKELGWGSVCLTEDMDFTMKLASKGKRVSWAHSAIVYDEKPCDLKTSVRQRTRWMQGHWDVASRYFVPLVKKAFYEKSLIPLDCALYLIEPVRIIATGIIMLFALIQTLFPNGDFGFVELRYIFDSPLIWDTISVLYLLQIPASVIADKHTFGIRHILAWGIYPIYNLTWVPVAIKGFLTRHKSEWYHTRHTSSININDILRGE